MPEFGTMAGLGDLLATTHRRGLELVMDLVVDHVSDEAPLSPVEHGVALAHAETSDMLFQFEQPDIGHDRDRRSTWTEAG